MKKIILIGFLSLVASLCSAQTLVESSADDAALGFTDEEFAALKPQLKKGFKDKIESFYKERILAAEKLNDECLDGAKNVSDYFSCVNDRTK